MGELLKREIENTRAEMIDIASKNGLLAKETTIISQKLDVLMNQYELCLRKHKPNQINYEKINQ